MQNLRDMTQQCGQPTALSQLATNITATNPSVLADAQVYKQGPQLNTNGPNPLEMQNVPTANNLMQQFNQQKPMQPMPMPMQPQQINQNQQQQNHHQQQQINQQPQMHPNQMQMQPRNYIPHQQMPQIMQMPQMIMPQQIMNMQYQMPQQMYQQQKPMQKQQESKEDVINTNGTADMKDEKEVQNELDELRPTHKDINQINQLLNETKEDDKMQNSNFMNFLKNIKNKPPIADGQQQVDQSQLWNQQFQGWNDPNDIDNMNWDSYMQAINPNNPQKDPEYEFAKENRFIDENKNDSEKFNYFEEGIKLMKNGNLNEAILAFEACVKQEPNRSEGWRYLGVCHADNENENSAISAYLKCNSLDPYDLDALLQLGVSYTNEIDPFRALNYLKQWMHNHPDYSGLVDDMDIKTDPSSNNPMGGYGGSKVQHKKVVNLFNKALSINAMDSDLHIVLGVLYNITSEFPIAENHFKKAIQSKPKDPSLWNKLGATQANGGKCKDAIRAYSKALQLKPNYVRALSNLGISFANQDMHKEACQSYLASLKLNNKADSVWDHLTMSLMHLNRGDLVELCKHKDVKWFKNHFDF